MTRADDLLRFVGGGRVYRDGRRRSWAHRRWLVISGVTVVAELCFEREAREWRLRPRLPGLEDAKIREAWPASSSATVRVPLWMRREAAAQIAVWAVDALYARIRADREASA